MDMEAVVCETQSNVAMDMNSVVQETESDVAMDSVVQETESDVAMDVNSVVQESDIAMDMVLQANLEVSVLFEALVPKVISYKMFWTLCCCVQSLCN